MRRQVDAADRDGRQSEETALDQHMERLMPFFKSFNHKGTRESWVEISKILGFCMRCKSFVDAEFIRNYDQEYAEGAAREASGKNVHPAEMSDPLKKAKRTTKPAFTNNKIAVTELLTIAEAHIYRPGRTFHAEYLWSKLGEVTTDVAGNTQQQEEEEVNDGTDERAATTVEGLLGSSVSEQDDNEGDNECNANDAGSAAERSEVGSLFSEGDLSAMVDDDNVEESQDDECIAETQMMIEQSIEVAETMVGSETAQPGEEKEVEEQEQELSTTVSPFGKKVPLNKDALRDVVSITKETLTKKNILAARALRLNRRRRQRHYLIHKLHERLEEMQKTMKEINFNVEERGQCRAHEMVASIAK